MATKRLNTRIQNKIDSEANWNNNPDFIPLKGEMIVYSKDANNKAARVKFGDGVTKLSNLKFSGGSGIPLTPVTKPTVRGSLTYNKNSQTPTWLNYDSSKMTISGTTSATNAGTYTATFTPLTGYCWEDDESTSAISVTWTINKAPANLRLNSTLLGIDSTFESKTFTYTTDSNGSIGANDVVYDAEGNRVAAAFDAVVNSSSTSITITKSYPGTDLYGTITVTQVATTNYLEANVEITVQAITGLDGYSWAQIAEFVGTGDAGNLGAIGDTKTITLTPNQRIRLPEGEENVKVFLADSFDSNGDGTGEAYGYLFAGFKDSEGKDIAITPDPKIREKHWVPVGTYAGSTSGFSTDDGKANFYKIASAANGTYKLGDTTVRVEGHWYDDTDGRMGQGFIYDGSEDLILQWSNFGSTIVYSKDIQITSSDTSYDYVYVDRNFYELLKLLFNYDEVTLRLSYVKWNDTIDLTGMTDDGNIGSLEVPLCNTGMPSDTLYVEDSTLKYINSTYNTKVSFYNGDGWTDTIYDRCVRYMASVEIVSTHTWWFIENTTPIGPQYIGPHWGSFNSIPISTIKSILNSSWVQSYFTPLGLFSNNSLTIPCNALVFGTDNSGVYESAGNRLSFRWYEEARDEGVLGTDEYAEFTLTTSDGDTHPMSSQFTETIGLSYEQLMLNIDSAFISTAPVIYMILDAMIPYTTIKGSWIWNESVATNMSSLPTSDVPMVSINFRGGTLLNEDGLPQQQYAIDWISNRSYLAYQGPNSVNVVDTGVFSPGCAAMHFGDEPQSVPEYFYEFLVANADYMSNGFGGGLIDDPNYSTGTVPLGIRLWQTPMSKVLGYTVDDHGYGTYETATNTLYEALPADFKEVLSNIYEEDPAVSGSPSIPCKYALPFLNEVGVSDVDGATGFIPYVTSTRLGYGTEGTDPIVYYHNGNTTTKYDVWNKTAAVLQHSASMGEVTARVCGYGLIDISDKDYVMIDNVEELRKPQFVSAGLAPIFLIGSTTEGE